MAEPGKVSGLAPTKTINVASQSAASERAEVNQAMYGRRLNRAEHLMNKGIETALSKHPLYSQDGKGGEADILVKYFNPYGPGRWYVLEGNKQPNGDWELYGITDMNGEKEYGYFMLSDLQNYTYKLKNGYPVGGIERDMYFGKKKVKDLKNTY